MKSTKQTLRKINKLLAKDLAKKLTVNDLEQHAKSVLEYGNLSNENKQFYKGFIRAFEILRKYGFLEMSK